MLEEYREMYRATASLIGPEWKKLSRSELCNLYLESVEKNDGRSDLYLSAIIYRFWNVANHNFYTQQLKSATEEDVYDWNIKGILYALEHHPWTDPESNLYGDVNGPEKAINVCIYSTKLNYYKAVSTAKRRLNNCILSIEKLTEENPASLNIPTKDKDDYVVDRITEAIIEAFKAKDYWRAFALDAILNSDVFEYEMDGAFTVSKFSKKKLKHVLRMMDDPYCEAFANMYELNPEDVKHAAHYVIEMEWDQFNRNMNRMVKKLKEDIDLIYALRER